MTLDARAVAGGGGPAGAVPRGGGSPGGPRCDRWRPTLLRTLLRACSRVVCVWSARAADEKTRQWLAKRDNCHVRDLSASRLLFAGGAAGFCYWVRLPAPTPRPSLVCSHATSAARTHVHARTLAVSQQHPHARQAARQSTCPPPPRAHRNRAAVADPPAGSPSLRPAPAAARLVGSVLSHRGRQVDPAGGLRGPRQASLHVSQRAPHLCARSCARTLVALPSVATRTACPAKAKATHCTCAPCFVA